MPSWPVDVQPLIREDEPLAPRCWLGLGGSAEFFAEPTSVDQLQRLVLICRKEQRPLRILGGGSNILVNDHGVPGLVLHLPSSAFGGIKAVDGKVTAGAGCSLVNLVSACARQGLGGLDPLMGIPGTVGGALSTNAGDRAADIGYFVSTVTVMAWSGEILVRDRAKLQFAYRESSLQELAILDATLELEPEDRDELMRRMQKHWIVRRSREPTRDLRTAFLFKDPPGTTAAELIEQAGLKGTTVGGAGLYERNLNFATTIPEASSAEVLKLIDLVRDRVLHLAGIELEQALQVW
jgi:UDP-N-acetylmuramate dehydrogenase